MNKKLSIFLFMLMTLIFSSVVCYASIIPSRGAGQIGYSSVVLCDSLTARQSPSYSSPSVQTLHYGDKIIVMNTEDGWAQVALSDDVDGVPVWVNESYVAVDPAYYRADDSTAVYAWNSTGAKKVALLDEGTTVPILQDNGEWIVVSLRGAAGWIHNPVRTEYSATPATSQSNSGNKGNNQSSTTQYIEDEDLDDFDDYDDDSNDSSFTVYAKDGATAVIHHAEGAMYEDARGRTYVKDDQDGYFYCISTDVTYAFDPTQWTGEAYGENEFPVDDDD